MNSEISPLRKIEIERVKAKAPERQPIAQPGVDLPVGIFDSGVGGLTVLSQFIKKLPREDVLYLADTARVPYGGRSPQEIININKEILGYFSKRAVKMVIMACGTSSSIAYPVLKDKYQFPIISLIEPGAQAALEVTKNNKIGILATAGTVNSGSYQNALKKAEAFAEACPLFVPLIEGGFYDKEETRKVARDYLKPLLEAKVDTIILGCTHYPHLLPVLTELAPGVTFIDPARKAVEEAVKLLKNEKLQTSKAGKGEVEFLVTGNPQQFEELGSKLLGKPVSRAKKMELKGV